jgi:uracil-DNA glycosylase family 4
MSARGGMNARDGKAPGPGGTRAALGGSSVRGAAASGPVPPGTGWPGDPATALTPVATDRDGVRALSAGAGSLAQLAARQSVCRACPRLVDWREQVAATRRRAFAAEPYWGRPVPGWGDDNPGIVIIGLAPAAHGGNRTGRIFTGDRSGDVLFESLWRCGLAAKPTSVTAGDGQRLNGVRMVAAVKCAPPDNKPTVLERDICEPWLAAELDLVAADLKVVVCLGHFAWQAAWRELPRMGHQVPVPRPAFGHGVEVRLAGLLVMGCYHPSQQNTFTGRVTGPMLDAVFERARSVAGIA